MNKFGIESNGDITCYELSDFEFPIKFNLFEGDAQISDYTLKFVIITIAGKLMYKEQLVNGILDMPKESIPPVGDYRYGVSYLTGDGRDVVVIPSAAFRVERWVHDVQ